MAKAKTKEKDPEVEEKDPKEEKDAGKKGKEKETDAEAAGAEGGDATEGAAAPKKSKKKLLVFGALALLILLGAGGGGYYWFVARHAERSDVELGADGKPMEKPLFYTLPEFLVNLNSGGKQTRFLKTTVILELTKQTDVPLVEANLPRLLDAFNTYLRELRASDLSGSAGIQRLREELLLRANKALAPTKINDVLFKDIIVQ